MAMKITQFGNPILRLKARYLTIPEIKSAQIQTLLTDMRALLNTKKYGVGLAAPQVGVDVAVAIISARVTPLRPNIEDAIELAIINPVITKTYGRKAQLWEGCISGGSGNSGLFAKVPRYKKIELNYFDASGVEHTETYSGLAAHIIQHEVDHLNGVLFVDRVKDTKSYMTYAEYRKMQKIHTS